ncbi:MAG: alpha-L-fucosidase [Defluviitaleaceae bacterium]|nr:alpha-L-fucosidase [Defluviitaleaceae bacterium]
MTKSEILATVDKVISGGPFSDDWKSLSAYKTPKWYEAAKFGIFIHWGVYSVPAFGNEWYPRNMYIQGSAEFEHHVKTYGQHKDFGYKDFIPMFKGEKFDASEWMSLFKAAGAKYVAPVAEHHDGFQMYGSDLSEWNAAKMGPCRDVVGELEAAAAKEGLEFALSSHRAEHCWFFNGGLDFDSGITDPRSIGLYSEQQPGDVNSSQDIYANPPSREHCEDWLARLCEIVDKYRPKIVFFDWWIQNAGFKPYLRKFAAYYYNRAAQWGVEVAINYKYRAFPYGTAVLDIERGQLTGIRPKLWQTDTAAARNSWGYTDNNDFKRPEELVRDLVDIVSKNGCLLLNVGPRPDGTITEEDKNILLDIGKWLKVNGEGIYGTSYWEVFGEGPTNIAQGSFTDAAPLEYTSEDFRFTYKDAAVYAFVMNFPKDGKVAVKSLKRDFDGRAGDCGVKSVTVLGHDAPVTFNRDAEALHIEVEGEIRTDYPVCFRIEID